MTHHNYCKVMSDSTSLGSSIDIDFFRENGYCILQNVFTKDELQYYIQLYDEDREQNPHMWVPFQQGPHSQIRNCDPLITSPHFDGLIRHPRILESIETIFEGEKCCLTEACLRWMGPTDASGNAVEKEFSGWHRDGGIGAHALHRAHRAGFLQVMIYLSDVDEQTSCFSMSPEPTDCDVHFWDPREQIRQRGYVHLHGPAGTCAIFNPKMLHAATWRPSTRGRKSMQIYYGHQEFQVGDYGNEQYMRAALDLAGPFAAPPVDASARDPEEEQLRLAKIDQYISRMLTERNSKRTMAEFTSIPPAFWRDHEDPEARAFYLGPGLNLRSKQFARAHGIPTEELPPGGPPLAETKTLPRPPNILGS